MADEAGVVVKVSSVDEAIRAVYDRCSKPDPIKVFPFPDESKAISVNGFDAMLEAVETVFQDCPNGEVGLVWPEVV